MDTRGTNNGDCVTGQGSCIDMLAGFYCECQPGYTGAQCQTGLTHTLSNCFLIRNSIADINECDSNPCVNGNCTQYGLISGSKVILQIDYYRCNCEPGYVDYVENTVC